MKKEIHQVDGKFYEKCQVVMLPTEKVSPICISNKGNYQFLSNSSSLNANNHFKGNYQHLYILSNEDIKEGDWVIDPENKVRKVLNIIDGRLKLLDIPFLTILPKSCKKIIATTDEELGYGDEYGAFYQLPRPSNEFLKKFCELNGIWEVLVEYERMYLRAGKNKHLDSYEPKVALDNTISIKPVQEEKLYNRDEVESFLFKFAEEHALTSTKGEIDEFNKWIKENL